MLIMWQLFELIYVCKLRHALKNFLIILILWFIFDHVFDPGNNKLVCLVFLLPRSMYNAICDLMRSVDLKAP